VSCLVGHASACPGERSSPVEFGHSWHVVGRFVRQAIVPAGGLSGRRPTDHSRSSRIFPRLRVSRHHTTKPEKFVAYREGGLKGRLHGRKPRSSGSPGLRRGRQFAHQRNCRRVVPRRGFHPLSWAEGPCGQARLPATQKAEGERRSSPGLNSQIAHDAHHFTSTVTDPNPEIARSRTITRTCCPSPAIATSPGMTRPFFIALSYSCCV